MDLLAGFILSECVEGPGITVRSTPLYSAYKDWYDQTGEFKQTQTRFSTRLAGRSYEKTKAGIVWIGIGLKSDDPDPFGSDG